MMLIRTLLPLLFFNAIALGAIADQKSIMAGKLSSAGSFYIEYHATEPIPLNKIFSLEFKVLDPKDKTINIKDVRITAQAWMPEHNHGTALQPKVETIGEGLARVDGFLFHMEGHWEIRVAVMADGQMERAVFDINL